MTHATQNSAFKNHPRNILNDENHLYRIISITSNTALVTRKHYRQPDIEFFLNHRNSNVCLPARPQLQGTKQRTATILRHNNKLTNGESRQACHFSSMLVTKETTLLLNSTTMKCTLHLYKCKGVTHRHSL